MMKRAALLAVVLVATAPRDVVCDEGSLDEYADPDEDEGLDEFGEPIVPPEAMAAGHAGHKQAHHSAIEAEEEARQQFYNSIGNDEVRPSERGIRSRAACATAATRRRRCKECGSPPSHRHPPSPATTSQPPREPSEPHPPAANHCPHITTTQTNAL